MQFTEDELKLIEDALEHYDADLISQKREGDAVQALLRRVRRGGKVVSPGVIEDSLS